MAKQLHGFRNGQKLVVKDVELRADTKTDDAWVLLVRVTDGVPVVRAAKFDSGRRYRQGTNPDRMGFLAYRVEYRRGWTHAAVDHDTPWSQYTDSAEASSVRYWLNDRLV